MSLASPSSSPPTTVPTAPALPTSSTAASSVTTTSSNWVHQRTQNQNHDNSQRYRDLLHDSGTDTSAAHRSPGLRHAGWHCSPDQGWPKHFDESPYTPPSRTPRTHPHHLHPPHVASAGADGRV